MIFCSQVYSLLQGKYPNIVRLYKYFETATAIYLLLEYARGGRLWDHISCYQRNKDSHDYLLNIDNRKNIELKKSASDESVTRTKTSGTTDVNPLPQVAALSLEGKDSSDNNLALGTRTRNSLTMQGSGLAANVSPSAAVASGLKGNNSDRLTTPLSNGNIDKDSTNKCTGKVSQNDKSSLFVKLDEYFSCSAQHVPEEHIRVWAAELVLAVAYLHTSGIICRYLLLTVEPCFNLKSLGRKMRKFTSLSSN